MVIWTRESIAKLEQASYMDPADRRLSDLPTKWSFEAD